MNVVDLILLALAAVFAWAGWRQGFLGSVLAFAGFVGGAVAGVFLAPFVLKRLDLSGSTAGAVALVIVLGLAVGCQIGMAFVARRARSAISWHPARLIDGILGALVNALGLVLFAWLLASAATAVPNAQVNETVRGSTILASLDRIMPTPARDVVSGLRSLVGDSGLPDLFAGLGVLPPPQVDVPDSGAAGTPEVTSALKSVVLVNGVAAACGKGQSGSGFAMAPDRVLTNAHVVAGVADPKVYVPGRIRALDATTVYFDPKVDVAVLHVPGLAAPALAFADAVSRGTNAVVAGYPHGGPLTASPARIRGVLSADEVRGTDIYGQPGVEREIYVLRGRVEPGDSGGPLLGTDGRVIGVIFAQAQETPDTGFALTAKQVQRAVKQGTAAAGEVGSGHCTSGD